MCIGIAILRVIQHVNEIDEQRATITKEHPTFDATFDDGSVVPVTIRH
jgi:hypothetical protein